MMVSVGPIATDFKPDLLSIGSRESFRVLTIAGEDPINVPELNAEAGQAQPVLIIQTEQIGRPSSFDHTRSHKHCRLRDHVAPFHPLAPIRGEKAQPE